MDIIFCSALCLSPICFCFYFCCSLVYVHVSQRQRRCDENTKTTQKQTQVQVQSLLVHSSSTPKDNYLEPNHVNEPLVFRSLPPCSAPMLMIFPSPIVESKLPGVVATKDRTINTQLQAKLLARNSISNQAFTDLAQSYIRIVSSALVRMPTSQWPMLLYHPITH